MILVVEDSPDDEALMVRALGECSVGPIAVKRDGDEALAYLLSVSDGDALRPIPDVVLLDMNLPKVKGLDVLRRIRASPRTRHIPVVILTSSVDAGELALSYELGANSFVTKPRDPHLFIDAVRAIARYWTELNRAVSSTVSRP